jgi:hypothetical protein
MSQRDSGYERKERDLYETPEWVTSALVPHIPPRIRRVWEPAAASGKMVRALQDSGYLVEATDIDSGCDFLTTEREFECDAVITNPPYEFAQEFIMRAMAVTDTVNGLVAMLLRTDFDHAAGRRHMFDGDGSFFSKKIVLTRRIRWFEDSKGSPSFNHAWFIWDWKHQGPPTLAYGP